jgi:tetratricopeptide (TPR) repeat protein
VVAVNQELAYLYNHEAVGKAKEALEFLDKVAKDIQPDDERIAQIHLLRIQSQLVLLKNDDAVKTMELLFDHFPTLKVTAQACKSVAIRLNEITEKWFAANPGKEPDEATKENLKKVSRYYSTWLRGAIRFGLDARPSDVLLVADTLYMTAKRLNGIPDSVDSFMDRRGLVQYPNYFEDADFVHTLLSSEQFKGKIPEKDRQFLMSRRAKCLGFLANQADTWSRAKTAYEDIIREAKIEDEKGTFSASTLVSNPELVRVYIEFATVYLELGRWNKIHYDNAIQRFGNVAGISAHNSEPWWIAQYQGLRAHFLRGKDKDILTAQIGLKMLQENYPNFDEGKYGLKEKFGELKKSIEMTGGK